MSEANCSESDLNLLLCSIYLTIDDFDLVYQGGHHNVYCNGTHHIKTCGGFCGIGGEVDKKDEIIKALSRFKNVYKGEPMRCSCDKWKERNKVISKST
jgi:hypothetical protein